MMNVTDRTQDLPIHGTVDEATADLVQVIDGSVAQLWETIESLERLQPRNLERFRVSIFGSARIDETSPLYSGSESAVLGSASSRNEIGRGRLRDCHRRWRGTHAGGRSGCFTRRGKTTGWWEPTRSHGHRPG